MKNIKGWVMLLLSCYVLVSCSAISKMTATEENMSVAEEESIDPLNGQMVDKIFLFKRINELTSQRIDLPTD